MSSTPTDRPADQPAEQPTDRPADQAVLDWKPVLAALGNAVARTIFARAALGELDRAARTVLDGREQKAVQGWLGLGILVEGDDGSLTVDGTAVRATLAVGHGEGSGRARAGVGKFLDGPRITTMPASPSERSDLLRWVRDYAMEPDEVLSEDRLNERLRVFHRDVAMIRRYLVDEGLLERTRSGTEYAIPAD